MKWIGRRQSDNVEDQRGMSGGGKAIVGGGGIAIVFFLIKIFFPESAQFVDTIQSQVQQNPMGQNASEPINLTPEQIQIGNFAKTVFADTEDVWHTIFKENGTVYQEPILVLFTSNVETACGSATAASGPFYCPGDNKVYIDLDFFEELKTRFGAQGGDFAIAYVIAHEVGHHVQNLLGTSDKMRQAQQGKTEAEANKLSVCLELQADFYAGLWTKYNNDKTNMLEVGDIQEALSAAKAVGDDAIQSKMQGHVVPDSFTHGSSEQRMYWFKKGYNSGDLKQGNTFDELL